MGGSCERRGEEVSSMPSKAPLVCAIMLTRDRPAMAKRAMESFLAQTYEPKYLCVFDTGEGLTFATPRIVHLRAPGYSRSIGTLRNITASSARGLGSDIVIHWDDDDWSHPNRIAEQVSLLQTSRADAVGYSDLLFWRTIDIGEAWLYTKPSQSPPPGTSLCYWLSTWERKPFPDKHIGEDYDWCRGLRVACRSMGIEIDSEGRPLVEPAIVAAIHGGNTSIDAYDLDTLMARGSREWKRVPEWDDYCRERMRLKVAE